MAKVTEAQKRKNYEATVGSSENDMKPVFKSKNEVVAPPKGIGSSENDMGPLPKGKGLELLTKEQYNKLPKIKPGSPAFSDLKSAPPGVDVDEQGNIEYKKKGGVIKDLKKAGFYDAKENKAKRLDIINKVTTKPQRIEMVDKMFSAKKMAKGGTASSRADGCAVRGKTRA